MLIRRFLQKFKHKISGPGVISEFQSSDYLKKYKKYKNNNNKRFILIVTMGRSGSRWLSEIFNMHDGVKGSCEEDMYAESFYKYVKWNQLPVDLTGVYNTLAKRILNDWNKADVSVIASPGISIDFLDIYKILEVDEVIWAVNDALFTITSFYNKGYYNINFYLQNPNLAVGYQPYYDDKMTRFFGRLVPRGEFFYTWKKLTRIGKISWYYNMFNMKIYDQMKSIPSDSKWIFKLDEADQNYDYYLKLAERFNLAPIMTKPNFLSIKGKSVSPSDNKRMELDPQSLKEIEQYSKEFLDIYPSLFN